jgi:elongation factor Ts
MAVTMAEISKLRQMTGAGMMDCKKALAEAENDMDKAIEILRKKGQAVAAKREDRNAAEGCVLGQSTGEYAAVVALNCETDFVAKNAGFVSLTKSILAAAVEAKAKSLDEVKALEINGQKIADLIVDESGKTGEKMELGAFEYVEAPATVAYNHFGNKLATLVAFNKAGIAEQVYKNVAMQVAAMNPIAVDECDVAEEVKEKEIAVAIEKTKAEQVQKAVDAALKKAASTLLMLTQKTTWKATKLKVGSLKKMLLKLKKSSLPFQLKKQLTFLKL